VAEVELVSPQDEVAAHGVVNDEPRDGLRDVPRHPDARRKKIVDDERRDESRDV
jgi:hypothetical protein